MSHQHCHLLGEVEPFNKAALTSRPHSSSSHSLACGRASLAAFHSRSSNSCIRSALASPFHRLQGITSSDESSCFYLQPEYLRTGFFQNKKQSRLQATGRVGGQVWTESSDSSRTESGANASTSEASEDPLGDKEEQFWQGKTDEETQRFLERQSAQLQVNEKLYAQKAAVFDSWRVLGGLSIGAAIGVTGYAIWEKEQYKVALKERSTAAVGVVVPMLPPPRDWTAWQVLPLCLSLLISLFCQRPQTVQIAPPVRGPLPAGAESSGLALRVHRLEEEFDSGIKTVRFLARQLEKLGVRFRLSRRTLRDPIREHTETIEAIKAELQITNARLLRLEEGLFEAQELMLAMQEQQAKQFAVLAAALPKVASAHRRFSGVPNVNTPKTNGPDVNKPNTNGPDVNKPKPNGPGGQQGSPVQKATSNAAKAVQAKAGQVLGSIRVPHVGKFDGGSPPGRATGGSGKSDGRTRDKAAGAREKTHVTGASVPGKGSTSVVTPGPIRDALKPGASTTGGLLVESKEKGALPERKSSADVKNVATAQRANVQNGASKQTESVAGADPSDGRLVYSTGSNGPLGMLSARDAESLVKDVEVPEHYLEERAMWEAYKNSLVDRRVDIQGGGQQG